MEKAIVIKKISNFFYCYTNNKMYESKALGNFNKGKDSIVVGDIVKIELNNDTQNTAKIIDVYERKNFLKRPYISNVDLAVVTFSVKEPQLNPYVIDSFLATIEKEDIDILICFSKVDLDKEKSYKKIENIYKNIGYKTIGVSAVNGENINELKDYLYGKTSVFAGPSGAGKSSLINEFSVKFNLKTSEISKKLQRGKNTTTYAELLKINDKTYIADTPGFTSIKLSDVEFNEVKNFFIEFNEYSPYCKFSSSCLHYKEPGCTVKDALENGYINESRYENYIKIMEELKKNKRY